MDCVNRPYKIGMLNLLKDWEKIMVDFWGIGQNFPKLEETAP